VDCNGRFASDVRAPGVLGEAQSEAIACAIAHIRNAAWRVERAAETSEGTLTVH
jgi:hypothetical protein